MSAFWLITQRSRVQGALGPAKDFLDLSLRPPNRLLELVEGMDDR